MSSALIEIDLWAFLGGVASVLVTLIGAGITYAKWQNGKYEASLDRRFETLEEARVEGGKHWDVRFAAIESGVRTANERSHGMERELDTRLDEHAARIAQLEVRTAGMPSHSDLAEIRDKLTQTATEVAGLAGDVRGIGDNVRLILNRVAERGL